MNDIETVNLASKAFGLTAKAVELERISGEMRIARAVLAGLAPKEVHVYDFTKGYATLQTHDEDGQDTASPVESGSQVQS